MKKKIKSRYTQFFKEVGIDSNNGVLHNNKKIKFATYPYIGSQYGKNTKILFIGLDIGEDERRGYIISSNERQKDIGNNTNYNDVKYNPHIAGTLVTAAYFSNKKILEKIQNTKNYKDAIIVLKEMGTKNPLAYVALTNFYKRVTGNRINRSGSSDRKFFCKESREHELKLLFDEIKIFKPDIIIFQSVEFLYPKYKDFLNELTNINKEIKIHIGPHPACRTPYSRIPKEYLPSIKELKR